MTKENAVTLEIQEPAAPAKKRASDGGVGQRGWSFER